MNKKSSQVYILFFCVFLINIFFNIDKVFASDTGVVSATVRLSVCGDNVKDYGEQCDLSDLGNKTCSDFGYNGGTLTCSFACEFDTDSCLTNATALANTTFLPTADRSYILPDGNNTLEINLPQDFYTSELSFFIFSHNSNDFDLTKPAPVGENFVGKIYDLLFVNENGERVSSLNKTSIITLSYNQLDLNSINEDSLVPYRNEAGSLDWIAIPNFTLNKINKTISFPNSEFSFFTIMGSILGNNNGHNNNEGGGGSNNSFPKANAQQKKEILKVADFNKDGRVDIVDLSILLYSFGKKESDVVKYDLNGDKKIDIVDVSIMLYYWDITS